MTSRKPPVRAGKKPSSSPPATAEVSAADPGEASGESSPTGLPASRPRILTTLGILFALWVVLLAWLAFRSAT